MKLTRRDLIRYGAGVSLVAAGGGWGALMADSHGLIEVTIPSSGRKVPAVGIGTVTGFNLISVGLATAGAVALLAVYRYAKR